MYCYLKEPALECVESSYLPLCSRFQDRLEKSKSDLSLVAPHSRPQSNQNESWNGLLSRNVERMGPLYWHWVAILGIQWPASPHIAWPSQQDPQRWALRIAFRDRHMARHVWDRPSPAPRILSCVSCQLRFWQLFRFHGREFRSCSMAKVINTLESRDYSPSQIGASYCRSRK